MSLGFLKLWETVRGHKKSAVKNIRKYWALAVKAVKESWAFVVKAVGEYWAFIVFFICAIALAYWYSSERGESDKGIAFVKDVITYIIACAAFILAIYRARIADSHSENSLRGHYLSLYKMGDSMLQKRRSRLSGVQLLVNIAKSAKVKSKFIHHINVMHAFSEFYCEVSQERCPSDIEIKAKKAVLEFLTSRKWRMRPIIKKIEEEERYKVILDGADLAHVSLSNAFLKKASLRKATLEKAVLFGADLEGADLANANLVRANLVGANLVGANLVEANLVGASLILADLTEANLLEADLMEAILPEADLTGAILTEANLTGAILTESNLTGANFTGAKGLNEISSYKGIWAYENFEPEGLLDRLIKEVRNNLRPLSLYRGRKPRRGAGL